MGERELGDLAVDRHQTCCHQCTEGVRYLGTTTVFWHPYFLIILIIDYKIIVTNKQPTASKFHIFKSGEKSLIKDTVRVSQMADVIFTLCSHVNENVTFFLFNNSFVFLKDDGNIIETFLYKKIL